jgi:hypothetical protein
MISSRRSIVAPPKSPSAASAKASSGMAPVAITSAATASAAAK